MWSSICFCVVISEDFFTSKSMILEFEVFLLDLKSRKSWNFVVPNVFQWSLHYVFIKFLMSFQNVHRVLNVFPNMFPIAFTRAIFFFLEFYFSNLYYQLKGGDYNLLVLGVSKDCFLFFSWPNQICSSQETRIWTLTVPTIN
jgi:hypothetical protein